MWGNIHWTLSPLTLSSSTPSLSSNAPILLLLLFLSPFPPHLSNGVQAHVNLSLRSCSTSILNSSLQVMQQLLQREGESGTYIELNRLS